MILVTGSSGFIGARICELLLDSGMSVIGLDNDTQTPIKRWRLERLQVRHNFTFYSADITDASDLESAWKHHPVPEAVIHCAALTGVRASFAKPSEYLRTNAMGTFNVLNLCLKRGVPRFVLASTSSVYGNNPLPFHEGQPADLPLSPYAASKKAAEIMAGFHRSYGMDVTVLRYFTVYGPAGRPDMAVWNFAERITRREPITVYGDGSQRRDFTFVDDIAEGTVAAMEKTGLPPVINLGASRPVSVNDLIKLTAEAFGADLPSIDYQPPATGDARDTWSDSSLAQQVLGWKPSMTLENGLHVFACWYRRHSQLALPRR